MPLSKTQVGKHADELTVVLDPSRSEDHATLHAIIERIVNNTDELAHGSWRGQGSKYYCYIKGSDAVVTTGEHNFVTILKRGTNSEHIKRARNKNGERS